MIMLGIMRAAERDREEAARHQQRIEFRQRIAWKYVTAPNVEISHTEFCRGVLKGLIPAQIPQALIDLEHPIVPRSRPTWFCRIFGCVPNGRCDLHPYCTDCQGRCIRCGIGIAPRVTRVDARRSS